VPMRRPSSPRTWSRLAVCVCLASGLSSSPAAAHWSAAPGGRILAAEGDLPPTCTSGGETITLSGTAVANEEGTYRLLPFTVAPGTTRIELHYDYGDLPGNEPGGDSVVDIGLWDDDGIEGPAAFRGWGGSHHGVKHKDRPPIWIQADSAHRGFGGGAVTPGTWHAEVGFGNVAADGTWFAVEVTCLDPVVGSEPSPDPVDPSWIANPEPGWYHGDFHMHALHSSPAGPTHEEVVTHAREVGLDFLPITEYVTTWHHATWGAVARANPDIVIWPGREVITYQGHAIVLGETPGTIEYRDGFQQISMASIQEAALADGALFGIAHPTIFPEPLGDMCRGCFAEYLGGIDLDEVTTIEVLTGPISYDASFFGLPSIGPAIEFPFMQTAIDLWESLMMEGHRITAVSGSDAKDTAGHGINATAVYAENLSRPALRDALARQRAYVRTRGVAASPELDLTATNGTDTVMIGGTLVGDTATLSVTVRGAVGQTIDVVRNGLSVTVVPVLTDPFTVEIPMVRGPDEGPLGTFYRVDVRDVVELTPIRTIVSNPIWIASSLPADLVDDGPEAPPDPTTGVDDVGGQQTPSTGPSVAWLVGLAILLVIRTPVSRSARRIR
ncbi:MAG: CehA/McbA family metallohydrolase, partial [Nitriliruptorales bacterium]|nr:CehA/McbA family metallohydrolase [Nitriliruptorales bacterium]